LATEAVKAEKLPPRRQAFGEVMDVAPWVDLDQQLGMAETALAASKAENARTQNLARTNDASQKAVEAAAAQLEQDELKLQQLVRSAQLQFGDLFPAKREERKLFVDRLVAGDSRLVRINVLPGDAFTSPPKSATLTVREHEGEPLTTSILAVAKAVDPRTQTRGYVARIDDPPYPLLPGMAVRAWLNLDEPPAEGLSVPEAALLRQSGRAWVYVAKQDHVYVREPVEWEGPSADAGSVLVSGNAKIKAGDRVVTAGAALLLSEEINPPGAGEPEP
jgi:multidrug efflux pump subunit AcrA (membrane-fusion protein)